MQPLPSGSYILIIIVIIINIIIIIFIITTTTTTHCHYHHHHNNTNNNNDDDDDDDDLIERRNSRFFYSAVSCLQHVRSSDPGAVACKSRAIQRALITCNMSCATWYKGTPLHTALIFTLGEETECLKKPLTTGSRKCHILKPENPSPNRDSNPHSITGGRLGKQTC